jgi:hypothetical protein
MQVESSFMNLNFENLQFIFLLSNNYSVAFLPVRECRHNGTLCSGAIVYIIKMHLQIAIAVIAILIKYKRQIIKKKTEVQQ